MWYALRIGFTYEEAMLQPVARVLTLMAIEQIKVEGARETCSLDVFDNETMDIDQVFPADLK